MTTTEDENEICPKCGSNEIDSHQVSYSWDCIDGVTPDCAWLECENCGHQFGGDLD